LLDINRIRQAELSFFNAFLKVLNINKLILEGAPEVIQSGL
jgi:hypothetical protein